VLLTTADSSSRPCLRLRLNHRHLPLPAPPPSIPSPFPSTPPSRPLNPFRIHGYLPVSCLSMMQITSCGWVHVAIHLSDWLKWLMSVYYILRGVCGSHFQHPET